MTSESEIRRNGKSSRLSALAQPFTVNRPSLRPNSTQFHPLPVSTASTSHINSGSSAYGHDRPPEIQPSSYYKPYPPDAHEPRAAYVIPRDPVSDSLAVAESAQAGYFSGLVSASHESGSVDGLGQGESSFSDSMDFSSLLKQGIAKESFFPNFNAHTAAPTISQTSEYGFAQPPIFRTSTNSSVIDSVSLKNVDPYFSGAARNKKNVHDLVSISEAQILCSASDGITCTEKVLIRNGERKRDEFVTSRALDPLVGDSSLPRINCPKVSDSVNPKTHGAEASGPVGDMFFDQNDSEVDSPCWKGTQFYRSTSAISRTVNLQHSSNELEACNRLNPLAPQFLPSDSRQTIDTEKEYDADDFSSFQRALSPSVAFFSGDHGVREFVKAGRCTSEVISVVGMQSSSNVHEPEIPCMLPHQSYGCSALESPGRDSNFVNLNHAGKVTDASNRLNPLAPHFVPATAKQDGCQPEKEYDGDDSSSLQKTGYSFVAFSSGDGGLVVDSVKAQRSSEVSNIVRTLSNANKLEIGNFLPSLPHKSSVIEHSCVHEPQPSLVPKYLRSNNQLVSGPNFPCSVRSISATENNSLNNMSFHVTENVLNSSSTEVELFPNFTQTRQGSCKSASSKIDGELLLNMMHELSELLIQHCSKDFLSMNESEHDIAWNVISNLCLYIRNTAPRDQKSESSHPGTSYSPRQLADEGKVTRTKGKAVQNDLEMKGSCSVLFDEALGSSCPGNNEGRGKANGITQMQAIAKNALQGSCGTEEMSPQALLFRSLWLKAEAALSFFNYQASASNVSK
ncbi:uncharacterized protein LOC110816412 isoform X3 [Carica papaya]|uniref:uncharacterized protein LOC110816412 isoform X3 n=1 Tax=Carica papaya TaxID=3649 RepID=UPI000B8C8570|nr:uncharacterized protein LOC110816412 isoform X3 [Carica papaya]